MKIYIKEKDKPIQIYIPNGLCFNRLVAKIGAQAIKKSNNIHIPYEQLYQLFKALKDSKKIFGHYYLVEVESKDGEIVKIQL